MVLEKATIGPKEKSATEKETRENDKKAKENKANKEKEDQSATEPVIQLNPDHGREVFALCSYIV